MTNPAARLPGPRGIQTWRAIARYYRDPVAAFQTLWQTYGDVLEMRALNNRVIHLAAPEDIHAALQNPAFEMSAAFNPAEPLVGRGLATNTGDDWLRQRRLIQPAFHHERISQLAGIIRGETARMLDDWETLGGKRFNLTRALLTLNHHLLGRIIFGDDLPRRNPQVLADLNHARTYTNRLSMAVVRIPAGWATPANHKFRQAVARLDAYTYARIASHRAHPTAEPDILSMLLEARDRQTGEGMTDRQLHDEVNTLIFAAYEDAANALTWAFHLLAQHPEVQAALAQGARAPEGDATQPLASQIINETLRLYPPTWSLLRDVTAPTEVRGCTIPAGANILINVYLLHRHPAYWDNPSAFQPSRFAGDYPKHAYIPFGAGGRKCIGYDLALLQMNITLEMIARRFRVIPDTAQRVQAQSDSTLRVRGGLWVRLETRPQ